MNKLQINQEITLKNKRYKVIGIDHYRLKNIVNSIKEWYSYTLVNDNGHKTWISYHADTNEYVQWKSVSKTEFKKRVVSPPNLELTGIAYVTFQGNAGYSTPIADLTWFDLIDQPYDYIGSEQFLKQADETIETLDSYYNAGKILKDFKI